MIDRITKSGWPPLACPAAIVEDTRTLSRTTWIAAGPDTRRIPFLLECLASSAVPRILVFAPDEEAAAPVRAWHAEEIQHRIERREQDRTALAQSAAERTMAEADRELAALRATATVKPGFLARLFGTAGPTKLIAARIAEWETKRATADAELRRLQSRSTPIPNSELRTDDVSASTPISLPSADRAFDPHTTRIVTPADFPLVGYSADLAFTVSAERVTAAEFEAISAIAPAHIVIGDPTPAISNSPYRNGVPAAFRTEFFSARWHAAPIAAWGDECGRIICRLVSQTLSNRGSMSCEPLLDRPEIELRFLPGDEPTLAEVLFPADFTAAQCRQWLASELGEARPVARGRPRWTVGESICAIWPVATIGGEWIDTLPGVREFIIGTDANALTGEMRFDPTAGWTRESAEAWLAEKLALSIPPAVELPAAFTSETTQEFTTAMSS